ncbi:MAG: peptidoglycan DD-metalloendopeptidase family protein [Burkholderiales bacterium]|nr:peptidoglycan DD-metalloendopeptidase family protein [Burkholderiales bacterium]
MPLNKGVDFAAEPGTPVYNIFDGECFGMISEQNGKVGFGHYVVVLHQTKDLPSKQRKYLEALQIENFRTFYAHLTDQSDFLKLQASKKPYFIKAGQLLGSSGSSGNASNMPRLKTGAHLHFEARLGDSGKASFDPLPLFNPDLIKDACGIYMNKHLENPQKHKRFTCNRPRCSGCHLEVYKEEKQPIPELFSINSALSL